MNKEKKITLTQKEAENRNEITVDLIKLGDEINLNELSEELPCKMHSVLNLLERASRKTIIDDETGDVRKKLKININIVREKAYYHTGLKKKEIEYLVELILKHQIEC